MTPVYSNFYELTDIIKNEFKHLNPHRLIDDGINGNYRYCFLFTPSILVIFNGYNCELASVNIYRNKSLKDETDLDNYIDWLRDEDMFFECSCVNMTMSDIVLIVKYELEKINI